MCLIVCLILLSKYIFITFLNILIINFWKFITKPSDCWDKRILWILKTYRKISYNFIHICVTKKIIIFTSLQDSFATLRCFSRGFSQFLRWFAGYTRISRKRNVILQNVLTNDGNNKYFDNNIWYLYKVAFANVLQLFGKVVLQYREQQASETIWR